MKYSVGISNFPEEISSLSHFIVFLYFFAMITEEGFLISPVVLWNSAFKWVYLSFSSLLSTSLLFTVICKPIYLEEIVMYSVIICFCSAFSKSPINVLSYFHNSKVALNK